MYPMLNFSQFVEHQILGPNLPKKMHVKNFEKINTKIVVQILQCTSELSFTQFGEYSILDLTH